jgi:protein-disulfide isomerase
MKRVGISGGSAIVLLAASWLSAGGVAGAKDEADAVAVVGGVSVGRGRLDELAGERLASLRAQEYEIKRRVLDEEVERLLLEQEGARRKQSVEELVRAEIDAKAKPVSEAEVQALYERVKDRLAGVPEPEGRKQVSEYLRGQRVQQRRAELVAELKARTSVRILLEPYRVAIEAGDAVAKGPKDAPVTIVEYADFQCPACGTAAPTLKAIAERYGPKLRIVFRDFPLPSHKDAPKASEAAACADAQGRFWEMYDVLFSNQRGLAVPDLKRHAATLGLDAEAFNQCLDSGRTEERWRKSRDEGVRYGVNATPTFFVNGRPLNGAPSFDALSRIVDEELERASPLPRQ